MVFWPPSIESIDEHYRAGFCGGNFIWGGGGGGGERDVEGPSHA